MATILEYAATAYISQILDIAFKIEQFELDGDGPTASSELRRAGAILTPFTNGHASLLLEPTT